MKAINAGEFLGAVREVTAEDHHAVALALNVCFQFFPVSAGKTT